MSICFIRRLAETGEKASAVTRGKGQVIEQATVFQRYHLVCHLLKKKHSSYRTDNRILAALHFWNKRQPPCVETNEENRWIQENAAFGMLIVSNTRPKREAMAM